MSSQFIDVKGKVKYIHAVNFNKFDKWAITIEPTDESRQVIYDLQAEGIRNQMKKDENNVYYIQFSREPTKLIKGKVVAFAAPRVIDNTGQPMDGTKVGWGSDATVRLEVYQHGTPNGGKSKAARFDSVRIDNLIPYDIQTMGSTEEAEAVKSLSEAPSPVWN